MAGLGPSQNRGRPVAPLQKTIQPPPPPRPETRAQAVSRSLFNIVAKARQWLSVDLPRLTQRTVSSLRPPQITIKLPSWFGMGRRQAPAAPASGAEAAPSAQVATQTAAPPRQALQALLAEVQSDRAQPEDIEVAAQGLHASLNGLSAEQTGEVLHAFVAGLSNASGDEREQFYMGLTAQVGMVNATLEPDAHPMATRYLAPLLDHVARQRRIDVDAAFASNLADLQARTAESNIENDFCKDLARVPCTLRKAPQTEEESAGAREDTLAQIGQGSGLSRDESLQRLQEWVPDPTLRKGVMKVAMQGIWQPVQALNNTAQSLFLMDGKPGALIALKGNQNSYDIRLEGDQAHITCQLKLEGDLKFTPSDGSAVRRPEPGTRVTCTLRLTVNKDGVASYAGKPEVTWETPAPSEAATSARV